MTWSSFKKGKRTDEWDATGWGHWNSTILSLTSAKDTLDATQWKHFLLNVHLLSHNLNLSEAVHVPGPETAGSLSWLQWFWQWMCIAAWVCENATGCLQEDSYLTAPTINIDQEACQPVRSRNYKTPFPWNTVSKKRSKSMFSIFYVICRGEKNRTMWGYTTGETRSKEILYKRLQLDHWKFNNVL